MIKSIQEGDRIPRSVWKPVILGGMASYLDAAVLVTAGIAFSLSMKSLRLSAWDVGTLTGLVTGLLAVGALVGGRLGDKYGRRRILTFDLLFFVAGTLLLTFSVSPATTYAGVVLTGLAMGVDLPVSLALIAESAPPRHRGRLVGFAQVLWGIGPSVTIVLNVILSNSGVPDALQARLLWGHVLVVAVVVWALRQRLDESQEWLDAVEAATAEDLDGELASTGSVDAAKLRILVPYLTPLVALGLFYTVGNFAPNTGGQFAFFILSQVTHLSVATTANVMLTIAPLGIVLGLVFIKIVDTRLRNPFMIAGGVLGGFAYAIPGIFGVTTTTYLIAFYASLIGSGFIGEGLYKVRTQEIFPALVRSTAQGATIFFCRISSAVLAVFTPSFASSNLGGLLWLLCAFNVLTLVLGLWVMRIPNASVSGVGGGEPASPATAVLRP